MTLHWGGGVDCKGAEYLVVGFACNLRYSAKYTQRSRQAGIEGCIGSSSCHLSEAPFAQSRRQPAHTVELTLSLALAFFFLPVRMSIVNSNAYGKRAKMCCTGSPHGSIPVHHSRGWPRSRVHGKACRRTFENRKLLEQRTNVSACVHSHVCSYPCMCGVCVCAWIDEIDR